MNLRLPALFLMAFALHAACGLVAQPGSPNRIRLIVETDAGGDPDDEQSLVRFLLYVNEWDVEGLIANRAQVRDGENLNRERTGLGVTRALIRAYGQCHSNLVQHDVRFPTAETLLARTVAGYDDTDDAVKLILAVVDRDDPRPVWYADWGTDRGAATVNMKRALDRVWRERGEAGYARFKDKLRIVGYDQFPEHTARAPDWKLWVNTFQPPRDGRRWYHRFSALTARAGGFDLVRDCLTGHGPLGALYPTNTTHWQKEGDTPTFLYLVPTGMNDPNEPTWGSWAGRYGTNENFPGKPFFWANQSDAWRGSTNRDNTLLRWAADLQNDFRARLDWCVRPRAGANHPPRVKVDCASRITAAPGVERFFFASGSTDPDGHNLTCEWIHYPEAGTFHGPVAMKADGPLLRLTPPPEAAGKSIHVVLRVSDDGDPPLARYQRVVIDVQEKPAKAPAPDAAAYFPPPESQGGWRQLERPADIRDVTGMDPAKLDALKAWLLASDQRNFAAVVVRRGHVVLEMERGNSAKTDARRVASVSKAICATVLAIASERSQSGFTPRRMTFEDPAFDFIPWAQPLSDPRKAGILVRQLLNHTSGICPEATGAPNDGAWDYILGHTGDARTARLAFDPGAGCGYSTHALHHAALVCETVTGRPYDQFAIEELFKPLGIEKWWFQYYDGEKHPPPRSVEGAPARRPAIGRHPSHGLGLPARDLARIGYCLLREGRWAGRQIVPRWFIDQTAAPTHVVATPELRWKLNPAVFTHGWELPSRHRGEHGRSGEGIPEDARSKPGSGGQLLAWVPSLDLVIARQTGSSGDWQYEEYLRLACAAVESP